MPGMSESAATTRSDTDAAGGDRPLRVLMAKVGLDGHDRGLRGRGPHPA